MKSKLPERWKEVDLGEIVKFKNGKKPKKVQEIGIGRYPLFGGNGQYGSTEESNAENSLVIGRVGAYCGSVHRVDSPFWISDNAIEAKPKYEKNLSYRYLYYKLKSLNLNRLHQGTSQPLLNQTILKNINIQLPFLEEQKAIADTLSALDDKIETNNKINKNLEAQAQAQALFKHWFVDFEFPNEDGEPYKSSGGEMIESELGNIPKGWSWIELNEIADLTMGLSPKSDTYNYNKIGLPLLNGASDFKDGLIKPTKYTSGPTRISKKNDLVFCIRATIGNLTFAEREYCIGRGVASLTPKNKKYKGIMYYNLLNSIERLISNASGSVILGLTKSDINNMKLLYPDEKSLSLFSDMANTFFKQKKINELENKALADLRNTLLPKLMSGELRIPLD